MLFSSVSVTLSILLFLMGAWPVVFFTTIETIVVCGMLWYLYRRPVDSELISIDEQQIRVTHYTGKKKVESAFQRYWARVTLSVHSHRHCPSRLYLASHGNRIEIGKQLSNEARSDLARYLKQRIEHRS